METGQIKKTVDLVEVFEMLFRHLPVILLCTVLAAAVGLAGSVLATKPEEPKTTALPETLEGQWNAEDLEALALEEPYTATALFMVRRDPLPAETGDAGKGPQGTAASADSQDQVPDQLVNTYSYLTRSEVVLSQVIGEMGLDISYKGLLSLGSITTQVMDASSIYGLTVTLPGKNLAQDVCERITRIAPDTAMELVGTGKVEVILPAHLVTEDLSEDDDAGAAQEDAEKGWTGQNAVRLIENAVFAAVLGFCACIGVLFVRLVLDNRINRETDVKQYLGLPVLGIIPLYEEEEK